MIQGQLLFLFLFLTIFFLFPEIEPHIDTQASKGVGHGEGGFAIVVGVEYERSSHIVFAVVPSDASAGNQVKIDVLNPLCPTGAALRRLVVDT